MLLPDVNVLVYAFRREAVDHERYRDWLTALARGPAAFALSDLACSGFLRVVTNPRIFITPAPATLGLDFLDRLRSRSNCTTLREGGQHWRIFTELVRSAALRGNDIPDAYHAALAIESGSTWVTCDRGFARFPGLRWSHPFDL